MQKSLKIGLLSIFIATQLMVSPLASMAAKGTSSIPVDECIPVSAPNPIVFEKNISKHPHITVMATYKWFETSEDSGIWTLKLDIHPEGGKEEWVSSYPSYWSFLFQKPVKLPKTITEKECEQPAPCEWNSEILASDDACEEPQPEDPPIGGPSDDDDDDNDPKPWKTKLSTDNHQCTEKEFDAIMDVREDGVGKGGVKVTFYFNGQTVEVRTNADGRGRTKFARAAGDLKADAEGYPSQSQVVEALDCEDVILDPGRGGQVLGATTLADTGTTNWLALVMIYAGLATMGGAAYAYRKTNG